MKLDLNFILIIISFPPLYLALSHHLSLSPSHLFSLSHHSIYILFPHHPGSIPEEWTNQEENQDNIRPLDEVLQRTKLRHARTVSTIAYLFHFHYQVLTMFHWHVR